MLYTLIFLFFSFILMYVFKKLSIIIKNIVIHN